MHSASERRDERIVQHARRCSYGFDTSRLHDRDDGKRMRIDEPVTEDDQEAGRALVGAFKAALPLRGLPRQQFVAAHRARLVVEAAASGQAGAAARARLAALDAAEVRFNSLGESLPTPWQLEEKQVVGRFFSFVRREEHGHETKLPKRKPRLTPFAVGELLGIAPYASPHTRLFWHSRQQRVVTALDGRSIVHNEHGTRVMSADGEFISLMLPVAEWLQGAELLNHEKDVTEWLLDDVSDNLPRGVRTRLRWRPSPRFCTPSSLCPSARP